MKKKSRIKLIIQIVCAAALCVMLASAISACAAPGGGQTQSGNAYEPSFEITGDVQNVLSIKPDGSGTDTDAEKSAADGDTRSGWRLKTLIKEADPYTESSAVYIQGWDGMMASIRLDELDTNWLVFGQNGWECISSGYPESLGVKEIRRVVVVADDPSEVPSSVNVMADDGIERTVSPGSLYIKDYTSSVEWQGESSKNEKSVSVLLTDSCVQIGEAKLKADGNKIITE